MHLNLPNIQWEKLNLTNISLNLANIQQVNLTSIKCVQLSLPKIKTCYQVIAYCFCADYWLRVKFPCLVLFTHRSRRLAHGSCLFTGSKGWRNTVPPDFQTNYLATNPLLISVSSFQNHTHTPPPPSRDYSWGTASRCLQLSVSFHMVVFGRKLEILFVLLLSHTSKKPVLLL